MEDQLLSDLVRPYEAKAIFTSQDLANIWDSLVPGDDPMSFAFVEDSFLHELAEEDEEPLRFRGGWTIKVKANLLRTAILTALITGALIHSQTPEIPAIVIPAVVPLLFEMERVRLKRSEELILLELAYKPEAKDKTAAELYALLPEKIRKDLSELDFADFLDSCRSAGLIDEKGKLPGALVSAEDRFTMRPLGNARFHIEFK